MNTLAKDVVQISCKIKKETEKAILIEALDPDSNEAKDYWIPLSQTYEIHRTFETTGHDTLVISKWIAETKGLY